jgi:hypothetical protein
MTFKAHYIPQGAAQRALAQDYWRTVYADSVNEATMLAKRYTRKGYMLGLVIQA